MKFSLLSHCTILTLAAVAAADNWDSCHCVRIKSTQTPAYCATKAVCKTLGSGFGYSAGAGEGRGQCGNKKKRVKGDTFYGACKKQMSGREVNSCCYRVDDGQESYSDGCFP
ncbi:hypothetical protein Forpi1262_v018337 [Fusarium oxysporum f. sp. raphani]|uniref:Uncharacterized protein n=1 Tax=Fusarium oxysporum f. sp. raphani TaxID=96318 RepID=A0A8J5NJY3_FUSOX|nr:hypothetical protein Forpi1262_v018337 [Fusarium oxysporum f. sp. raphani]